MTDQPLQLAISLEFDLHLPLIKQRRGFDDKSCLAVRIRRLILHDNGHHGCEKHQRQTEST